MSMRCLAAGAGALAALAVSMPAGAASTAQELQARVVEQLITPDGEIHDWAGLPRVTVPLSGTGGADHVELAFAIRGDRIYLLASGTIRPRAICTNPIAGTRRPTRTRRPTKWKIASRSPLR
jgi:hypothetical protein